MDEPATIPADLRAVAFIQLIVGILCAMKVLVSLFSGTILFSAGVLGIPICFGLLNLRNGWRVCAMVLLWITLILFPVAFVVGFTAQGPASVHLFGIDVAKAPAWLVSVLVIPFFVLALWQYRVLVRPDVQRLFMKPSEEGLRD